MNYKEIKIKLYEESGGKCPYCGNIMNVEDTCIEHIVPKYKCGKDDESNLILVCRRCNIDRADKELQLYLINAQLNNTEYFMRFESDMKDIIDLLKMEPTSESAQQSLYYMLYTNIIISMETYLSDAIINNIKGKKERVKQAIENIDEFKSKEVKLSDIYITADDAENLVVNYLSGILYHNLGKVNAIYKAILNIRFPKNMGDIYKAVQNRHDIVHRKGKSQKSGEYLKIDIDSVNNCMVKVKNFIIFINRQLDIINNHDLNEIVKKKLLNAIEE